MIKERNYQVDILRAVGSILLILAHVDPPRLISEIRTFDVVLLAILSGISVGLVNIEKYSFKKYFSKRIKKLVFPTYICLIFVFLSASGLCFALHKELLYDFKTMLYSFVFASRGMGYVWIVKVYIIMALFAIPLVKLSKYIKSDWIFISLIIGVSVFQYIILRIPTVNNIFIISDYLYYIIPYITMEAIGIRWIGGSRLFKRLILISAGFLFIVFTLMLGRFEPSSFKYPPDYYYLTYGTLISIILLSVIPNKRIALFEFVSINSFDIYLIHIIVLLIYNFGIDIVNIGLLELWWIKFIAVTLISVMVVKALTILRKKVRILK